MQAWLLAVLLAAPAGGEKTLAQLLRGPLTQETIKDVIHEHHADLRACALRRPEALQQTAGKIVVSFTILPSGKVERVGRHSATLEEPELEKCLLETVKVWTFPRPKKGAVEIHFPFRFGPPPPPPSRKKPTDRPPAESEPDLLD